MKPTAADIAIVIGKIEAGDWLDPSEEPISWSCVLYDPDGERVGDGDAHTAREAMAPAWVHTHAPDALIISHVSPGEVPYDVPDGWRFELTRPWRRTPNAGNEAAWSDQRHDVEALQTTVLGPSTGPRMASRDA